MKITYILTKPDFCFKLPFTSKESVIKWVTEKGFKVTQVRFT